MSRYRGPWGDPNVEATHFQISRRGRAGKFVSLDKAGKVNGETHRFKLDQLKKRYLVKTLGEGCYRCIWRRKEGILLLGTGRIFTITFDGKVLEGDKTSTHSAAAQWNQERQETLEVFLRKCEADETATEAHLKDIRARCPDELKGFYADLLFLVVRRQNEIEKAS